MSYDWSNVTAGCVERNSYTSPNGRGGVNGQTQWSYAPASRDQTIIEPFISFYRNPPPGVRCGWSTNYGQFPPKHIAPDAPMPERGVLTLWNDAELWDVAQYYMSTYWEELKFIVRPDRYEDLYHFFDAVTLWRMGAHNAWNLINMLVTHAHEQWPLVLEDWKTSTNEFIDKTLHTGPDWAYNQEALRKWNGTRDIIFSVAFKDWPVHEFVTFGPQQLDILREALVVQYVNLTGLRPAVAQFYPAASRPVTHLSPTSQDINTTAKQTPTKRKGPLVACGDLSQLRNTALATPVSQNTVAARNTPPSGPLTPVPEESAPAKTDVDANILSQAVTESDTNADKFDLQSNINTTDHNTKSSHNSHIRKRNHSVSSAPGNECEPLLNDADSNVQKRVASEAPAALQTQPQQKPHTKVPQPAAPRGDMNMGTRPVSAGNIPYDSAQRDDFAQRNASEGNPPMYQHTQPPPFQQKPWPPAPARHPSQPMMTNLGPPNGSLNGPPNAVMQGPAPLGPVQRPMHPNAPGYMPGGPPAPGPGISMPPANPPQHVAPFQDQLCMPPTHSIGPGPQFDSPRGPIMNGPPRSMPTSGPPNTAPIHGPICGPPMNAPVNVQSAGPMNGPPMNVSPPYMGNSPEYAPTIYQPNGQHPRPEHDHRGSFGSVYGTGNTPPTRRRPSYATPTRGNRAKSGARRNSAASTGSRKIGDDPLHGPVYALGTARKASNASSGRRPSKHDLLNQGDANQIRCNNQWANQRERPSLFRYTFKECICPRCDECTRSIYVKAISPSDSPMEHPRAIEELKLFFQYLNPVSVRTRNSAWTISFHSDVDAIRAVQDACANPDRTVPGWRETLRVWYPFFSKHYYSMPVEHPKGLPWQLYNAQNKACQNGGRRNSNPFLTQRQHRRSHNGPHSDGNFAPGPVHELPRFGDMPPPGPMPYNGMLMPYASARIQQQQLKLWEPSASPCRESGVVPLPPRSQKGDQSDISNVQNAKKQLKSELIVKEDWRSKPPSEEALDDDDEAAVTDAASVHSSQSGKSIKVSLPDENGSAREAVFRPSSRSASPGVETKPIETHLKKDIPEDDEFKKEPTMEEMTKQDTPNQEGPDSDKPLDNSQESIASSRTVTPDPAHRAAMEPTCTTEAPQMVNESQLKETAEKVGSAFIVSKRQRRKSSDTLQPKNGHEKKDSGYRKTLTDLAAPVEASKYGTVKSGYRKTGADINFATESPFSTVIHRPQSRSPLPSNWTTASPLGAENAPLEEPTRITTSHSRLRGRFGQIDDNIGPVMSVDDLAEIITTSNKDAAQQQLAVQAESQADGHNKGEQQTQQFKRKKNNKSKKTKGEQGTGSRPPSSATATTSNQSRGPSPAFSGPPSLATTTNPSSSRAPSPAVLTNSRLSAEGTTTNKQKWNRKQNNMETSSGYSDGLAKGNGPQDNKGPGTRQDLSCKPESSQPESVQQSATAEVPAPQITTEKQNNAGKNASKYRAGEGGSLRMEKNRAPEKATTPTMANDKTPAKADPQSLATVFQPPVSDATNGSPEPHTFSNQKQLIDQMVRSRDAPPVSTFTTHTDRDKGGLSWCSKPLPSPAHGNWAAIAKGCRQDDKDDDPFIDRKAGEITISWKKKESSKKKNGFGAEDVKIEPATNKPPSPTSSPEKKAVSLSGKTITQLNATAESFDSSRASSPAAPLKRLNPAARPFPLPPSPAMSVMSGTDGLKVDEQKIFDTGKNKKKGGSGHSKKASAAGVNKQRFVTPAEQTINPSRLSQPAPPTKEKKMKNGPLSGRSNPISISVTNPGAIPANNNKIASSTANSAKTQPNNTAEATHHNGDGSAPHKTDDNFPTLGESAAAMDGKRKPSSMDTAKLEATADKAATKTADEHGEETEGTWQKVSSNRKPSNRGGSGFRGRGGRGSGGRGGRGHHHGRGGRGVNPEERKGG